MPKQPKEPKPAAERPTAAASRRRGRHGRGLRSSVTGAYLPPLRNRRDDFDLVVAQTVDFVRESWPDEMSSVSVYIASAPAEAIHGDHIDRWNIDAKARSVTLFRMPITRFDFKIEDDDLHRRMMIEGYVLRALAELLGKEPWDLARFHYGQ